MDQPECDKLSTDVQTYFTNLDGPKYSVHVFPAWMAKFGTCLMFEGIYRDGKMVRAEIYGVPGWINYGDYDPSSANLLNDKCHVLNSPCTDADSFLTLWNKLSDPNSYASVETTAAPPMTSTVPAPIPSPSAKPTLSQRLMTAGALLQHNTAANSQTAQSMQQVCSLDNLIMTSTGQTKVDTATALLLKQYRCPNGHIYWVK
ncbi:MAG TPA: hypothetical protein VG273_27130 [Bryobacteraceae bacterium]|jgi:hypothetical protein|nr:hypothetical protein [Bryobacteraceae bacterium]